MSPNPVRRGLVLAFALGFVALPFVSTAARTADVTVFAAASLKNALDDAAKLYETKTGDKVVVSYAASSTLAKQIEQGAPADIFFAADLDWMDYLEQKKLIDPASRHTLLGNTLVLIAPKDSDVSLVIEKNFPLLPALGADGKLAIGAQRRQQGKILFDDQRDVRVLRRDQHQSVAEQGMPRGGIDELLLLKVVHPIEVGRKEDIGRCPLLDLLGERRGGRVTDHDLVAGLGFIKLRRVVERIFEACCRQHVDVCCSRRGRDERQGDQPH